MVRGLFTIAAFVATAPAMASGLATVVPEPADAALFALAVAGLIFGRQASRRRSVREPEDDSAA